MIFCMVRDFAGVIKLLLRGYSGLLGESIVITRILKIKRERERREPQSEEIWLQKQSPLVFVKL